MGVATLPSSGSTDGSSDVSIANNGVSGSAAPTFTVSKSASSVDEGSSVTFTITASSAVSADTAFSWTVIGDNNGGTVQEMQFHCSEAPAYQIAHSALFDDDLDTKLTRTFSNSITTNKFSFSWWHLFLNLG